MLICILVGHLCASCLNHNVGLMSLALRFKVRDGRSLSFQSGTAREHEVWFVCLYRTSPLRDLNDKLGQWQSYTNNSNNIIELNRASKTDSTFSALLPFFGSCRRAISPNRKDSVPKDLDIT